MSQYQVGDDCLVIRDVVIDGRTAFYKGNYISISSVIPGAEETNKCRYGVHSDLLGEDVYLLDTDIARRGSLDFQKEEDEPKVGDPQDEIEKKRALYGGLHRVLFLVGLACLILGLLFSTVLYQKEAPVGGYLLGAVFLIAIGDAFAFVEYRKYKAKPSQKATVLQVVVVAVCISIVVTLIGVIVVVNVGKGRKRNAYVAKATDLIKKADRVMEEEGNSSIALGKDSEPLAALDDWSAIQAGYAALAGKYIPVFQGYSSELKSIKKELIALDPAKQYKVFHGLYVECCENLCSGMASIIEGIQLLLSVDETTDARIDSNKERTARYLDEAHKLRGEALQSWPTE